MIVAVIAFQFGPLSRVSCPARPTRSPFGAKMNGRVALSVPATHDNPAPAAQLATGWASSPGPG